MRAAAAAIIRGMRTNIVGEKRPNSVRDYSSSEKRPRRKRVTAGVTRLLSLSIYDRRRRKVTRNIVELTTPI